MITNAKVEIQLLICYCSSGRRKNLHTKYISNPINIKSTILKTAIPSILPILIDDDSLGVTVGVGVSVFKGLGVVVNSGVVVGVGSCVGGNVGVGVDTGVGNV